MELNSHEGKLIQALRAEPNRVEMWCSLGDPMKNHKRLLGMYARFFEIATAYDVEYWLEYGSVLGAVRGGGINPWEWDMDIGCTPKNFARLLEIGAQIEATDPKYGFKYYRDPDYETPAFCFYVKGHEDCLCDIAEYLEEGDKLVCAVESWHYPAHDRADILPPKRVALLGQMALLPARPERFLKKSEKILGQCTGDPDSSKHILNSVPWQQLDPIPFLLSHMFHPQFIEKALTPPVVDIAEASSIVEGLKLYAAAGRPFVVRGVQPEGFAPGHTVGSLRLGLNNGSSRADGEADSTGDAASTMSVNQKPLVDFDLPAFEARVQADGTTIQGWDVATQLPAKNVLVTDALRAWRSPSGLSCNFTDAFIANMLPSSALDAGLRGDGQHVADGLCLVLSSRHAYTPFHQDPVARAAPGPDGGARCGGGWMWLAQGLKAWQFIDLADSDALYDPVSGLLRDPPIEELLYHDAPRHPLWGRISQCVATGGDFVYFPPGCSHRVWTHSDAMGVGGYIQLPSDAGRVAAACEWYGANGRDPAAGLFAGNRRTVDCPLAGAPAGPEA